RFEGNNYSDEWREEAERRALPNLRKTPEALAWLVRPESTEFFERMGLFNHEENESRYHVKLERYLKDVEIEVEALQDLAHTSVLPAAYKQQMLIADSIRSFLDSARQAGLENHAVGMQTKNLQRIANLIAE